MWVFKDPATKDFKGPYDYFVCASDVKKRDIHNIFSYYRDHDMYPITIWEFKDLANVDLNKITINQNINLDNIKFRRGEILDSDSSSPITINYGFVFHNAIYPVVLSFYYLTFFPDFS